MIAADAHEAFEKVEQIQAEEGRFFVHPFEGVNVATARWVKGDDPKQLDEFKRKTRLVSEEVKNLRAMPIKGR